MSPGAGKLFAVAPALLMDSMVAKYPKGWQLVDDRLRCTYEFKDFVRAMTFLHEVAHLAERREHHPDFTVHWNRVDFRVWSHDVNAVTERDEKLVAGIDKIAERHGAKLVSPLRSSAEES